MIRVNFIQDEIALSKAESLRRRLIFGYILLWLLAGCFIFARVWAAQNQVNIQQARIAALKRKIDRSSPQFKQAVVLQKQLRGHRSKLEHAYREAVESRFISDALSGLSEAIPANFWLTEVHFSAMDTQESDDIDSTGLNKKHLIVKGNIFLNLENENDTQVADFLKRTQTLRPFSLAKCRIDLNKMVVAKQAGRYYHNFAVEYGWRHLVL